jgi:hypothetical protein
MMTSDLARNEPAPDPLPTPVSAAAAAAQTATTGSTPTGRKAPPPPRPPLAGKPAAPVIVKRPPPFSVGVTMVCWVSSLLAGAGAVIYLMVIRTTQLPEITAIIQGVDADRAADTYEVAADIVFWSMFGVLVAALLLQIAFVVAFANRRPNMRWWMFGSLILVALVLLLGRELVTVGERGRPVEVLLLAEVGLLALGLLMSVLPGALRWSARRHDIRRGADAGVGGEL